MDNSEFDYSPWVNQDTWTLKETIMLVRNHYIDIANRNNTENKDEKIKDIVKTLTKVFNSEIYSYAEKIVRFPLGPDDIPDEDGYPVPPIDPNKTTINVKKFIKHAILMRFELPNILKDMVKPIPDSRIQLASSVDVLQDISNNAYGYDIPLEAKEISNEKGMHDISTVQITDHRYRFEKAAKGWNLQYDDVVLNGVKDWAGMKYIKMLLQNPGKVMDVLKLQTLLGSVNIETEVLDHNESEVNGEFENDFNVDEIGDGQEYIDSADTSPPNYRNNAWETVDARAIQEYRESVAKIEEQLKSARSSNVLNKTKIQRLENAKTEIEKYLNEANYKPKDPDVEKARKSVSKAIMDAFKKIKKLEELSNYNDKPIYSHLKRYIKTGSCCSYTAEDDNLPPWKF